MNYENMNEFQINKEVALRLGLTVCGGGVNSSIYIQTKEGNELVDYCNKSSDAWPIITDNNICVESGYPVNQYWIAYRYEFVPPDSFQKAFIETHSKPLRAAMLSFLMIQDEE